MKIHAEKHDGSTVVVQPSQIKMRLWVYYILFLFIRVYAKTNQFDEMAGTWSGPECPPWKLAQGWLSSREVHSESFVQQAEELSHVQLDHGSL